MCRRSRCGRETFAGRSIMKGKLREKPRTDGGMIIQFNLVGLILFTISLVLAAGFLAYNLAHAHTRGDAAVPVREAVAGTDASEAVDPAPKEKPARGGGL